MEVSKSDECSVNGGEVDLRKGAKDLCSLLGKPAEDSLYLFSNRRRNLLKFLVADKLGVCVGKRRLLDIYTDHAGIKGETENLMASLKRNGFSFFAGEDTYAMLDDLRTNKLVLPHTDIVHNNVVAKRDTFEQFFKTSSLESK